MIRRDKQRRDRRSGRVAGLWGKKRAQPVV
jgi:hypothetical protein